MRPFLAAILSMVALAGVGRADEKAVAATKLKLAQSINITKPISWTWVKWIVEYFSERCDIKMRVDHDAFRKAKMKDPMDLEACLPKVAGIRFETALRVVLRSAWATYRIGVDGEIVIVPDKIRPLAEILPPPAAWIKETLRTPVTNEKPIDGAPLKDLVEFLSDRYETDIMIDIRGFSQRKRGETVEEAEIKLGVFKNVPLEQVLREVAKQVEGTFIVSDELIIVVPGSDA
jgi:hypothetical protein